MKSLLIQCLSGNGIGKIKLNHINNNKKFYFVCKYKDDLINESEGIKKVLILEYQEKNSDRYCVGVAEGDIEYIERIDNNFLIKINNFETNYIKYNNETGIKDNYSKIRDAIKIDIRSINEKYGIQFLNVYSLDNTKKFIKEINEKNKKTNEKYEDKMKSIDELEEKLRHSAQRSRYVKRVIAKGEIRENRTEFQRDWERIIHAKSFRRLEDKAQIYTLSKGDHFRTRLTHTLEVTQIARGIARELKLNEDLVEAIALGHDLGHTPFGHVGERTLNEILQNEGVKGGFKHNFQGVKVMNYLEEKYGEFEGIDLTYQVMEGILKHTKICSCNEKCSDKTKGLECSKNIFKLENFLCNGDIKMLHPEFKFATTLEGQVVAVADEIAQRAHDLDDGIANEIINEDTFLVELKQMATEEFIERLENEIAKSIYINDDSSEDKIKEQIEQNLENIARENVLGGLSQKRQNEFLDLIKPKEVSYKDNYTKNKIVFDKDNFVENIEKKVKDFNGEKALDKDDFKYELYNRICKSLDYIDEEQRDYIDTLDIKRARIVSDVITYFIARIIDDSEERIKNYEDNHKKELEENSFIKEELIKFSGETEKVREQLEKISSNKIINSEEVNCFDGKGKYVIKRIYKAYKTNPMQMSKTTLKRIFREVCKYTNYAVDITDCSRDDIEKEIAIYNGEDNSDDIKIIKHKVFVRCLVDLISGMTDDFANRQYDKLYSPRIY